VDDDKREQVFVSSTFVDLIEERQAVTQVLLSAGCIPAGMELFPASNDDRWKLIQRVIAECDYYLLILGGRYGSVDPDSNLSFTEMEYDYAVAAGKPVMAFLHGKVGSIERDKTDVDPDKWDQLSAFRLKVESAHIVKYWTGEDDLSGKVALALFDARRTYPAVGWVRGDRVMTERTKTEIAELRTQVIELTQERDQALTRTVHKIENLASGDDEYEIRATITYRKRDANGVVGWNHATWTFTLHLSWNELFAVVAPVLLNEASERELKRAYDTHFFAQLADVARKKDDYGGSAETELTMSSFDDLIVQFFALGLVARGERKRTTSDNGKYWMLTQEGSDQMMRLRAIRREE
jgi:hypothetical protein